MHFAIYLPILFSGLFGACAPALGRHLPPAVNTWLISLGGALVAAGTLLSLALQSTTLIGQSPVLAELGHWSHSVFERTDPVGLPLATVSTVLLVALGIRVVVAAVRRLSALRSSHSLAATLPLSGAELVVTDEPGLRAWAVPGRPGRIVVSAGLLRSLTAEQRRAVLVHERTHLIRHHHLHHTVTLLSAAANPLLGALPAAVALATERWADENAAAHSPRDAVADALLRAASGARPGGRSTAVLAAAETDVVLRIAALRSPAPQFKWWRVALPLVMVAATAITTVDAARDTDHLFDHARQVYQLTDQQ